MGSRFQALSDVIAQRPTAGVTPQLEARIIDANALAFPRQERDAALAASDNIVSRTESVVWAAGKRRSM